ncbi:MAG: S8 family serine peptidase [Gemmatimonadales bacterium]
MSVRTLPLILMVAGLTWKADLRAQDVLERNVPSTPTFAPGQLIVKMRTGRAMAPARLGTLGLDTVVALLYGAEYLYRVPPAVIGAMADAEARRRTLALLETLRGDPDVEYVQPNYRLYIVGDRAPAPGQAQDEPSDPRWDDQWHYHDNGTAAGQSPGGISLPLAWQRGTGSGTTVASILDTGILPDHEDISGSPNLVPGRDMISDPSIANDGDGRDADPTDPGDGMRAGECGPGNPPVDLPSSWHGTHVAGTVGVVRTDNGVGVAGVNHRVSVQPVRVLGKCGGLTSDINDAIRWAAGLAVPGVPANPTPAKVINMSLGSPAGLSCAATPAMQAAINDAVRAGAVVVVAAGNEATDASAVVPASCENVITVAASDARGHLATRYSNFGATIEIMAPGGDVSRDDNGDGNPDGVLSTVRGGYAFYNGTSMAAPHVAGVAALWLAQDPALTTARLTDELRANALRRTSTQCPRPCGAGLLSAARGAMTVTLALDPDKRYRRGETATVTATVTEGGTPRAGVGVAFRTDDPSVAAVAPSAASTDASGRAGATLTAGERGTTNLTATADGATATKVVRVPSLGVIALMLLVAALGVTALFRRRHVPRTE